jgi:hypothetical protein
VPAVAVVTDTFSPTLCSGLDITGTHRLKVLAYDGQPAPDGPTFINAQLLATGAADIFVNSNGGFWDDITFDISATVNTAPASLTFSHGPSISDCIGFGALIYSLQLRDECLWAYEHCNFYFQGHLHDVPTYSVATPNDQGVTDIVRARDGSILGQMNDNNPTQFIRSDGSLINVNLEPVSPQSFSPFQWKAFGNPTRIGHETFQGNQIPARNRCVKINFTSWQVLDGTGNVVGNVNINPPSSCPNCCVVFMTN